MSGNDRADAEELYLEIYSFVAERADYMQPSRSFDLLIPDTAIAILVSTIVTALLNGFFGELGKKMTSIARRERVNDGELVEIEQPKLISLLDENLPTMRSDEPRLLEAVGKIESELRALGLARDVSHEVALGIIQLVRSGAR